MGREIKAIDRLDQESRRHLNKQRAKALAEATPGEPIDAAYEPSEAAKTDEYIAGQEKEAWNEMIRDANSGLSGTQGPDTGQGGQQGGGQGGQQGQGQQGQGQQGQQGQGGGQGGGQGQGQGSQGQAGQQGQSGNSPLRGGSASSASAILDQLKGRGGSGSQPGQGQQGQGQAPQGQTAGQGQSPQGQSPQGQAPQGQGQGQVERQAQNQGQGGSQGQTGQQSGQQSGDSPLRGGSANSASSILDQLRGRSGGSGSQPEFGQGQGQAPQGQTAGLGQSPQGQSQTGQAPTGQSPTGQGQSGQEQSGDSPLRGGSANSTASILEQLRGRTSGSGTQPDFGQGQSPQGQAQTGSSGQSQGEAQVQQASGQAQGQADNGAGTQADIGDQAAQAAADAAAEAAAHHDDSFSPLERIQRAPLEQEDTGGRTSASDFLNGGKN